MKYYTILVASFLLFSCGNSETKSVKLENPIELGKAYGLEKIDTSSVLTVAEMLKDFEESEVEKKYTFLAPIEEVCSKAGCWINVDKGNGETFMVRFKDHFTIPPKTKIGTEAYLSGVAYWDTVSVEMLQHFAEDAGKSKEEIAKITKPKFELGFEADGIVLIK